MKDFRTFQLAVSFYKASIALKLTGHIGEQLKRASLSIALNLAEGRGKPTLKDQRRFFHIAFGSVRECQAILLIAGLEESDASIILDSVAAHLYRLLNPR